MIIIKYAGDTISGSLFNLYELGLVLADSGYLVSLDKLNLDLDFGERYTRELRVLENNEDFIPGNCVLSNGCSVLYDKKFDLARRFFILCSCNFKDTLAKSLQVLGSSKFNEKISKTSFFVNPLIMDSNIFQFDQIPYFHGLTSKFYKKSNTRSDIKWYSNTSEYVPEDQLEFKYVNKSDLNRIKEKYWRGIILDTIETLTPYYKYHGYIYIKHTDFCPRLVNEFLFANKPVMIESLSEGLQKYHQVDENLLGENLLDFGFEYKELDLDFELLEKRLEIGDK